MVKTQKTILFVCPYPAGQAPSQRFRFEQYLDFLKSNDFSYTIAAFLSIDAWNILYLPGNSGQKIYGTLMGFLNRFWLLFSVHQYDYIFIHREAAPLGPPLFEWFVSKILRKKVIYDFDDAIWLPNTSKENRLISWLKWNSKVRNICKWSFKISGGNNYLCTFAKQFNDAVVYNPTTIDTEHLHNPALYSITKERTVTIGWTGTHSTLKYLDSLTPVLDSLDKKFPGQLRFLVIADKKPSLNIRCLQFKTWSKENEIQDLLTIDIGIMPLTNDKWTKGKCGFKALQFMALGIPVIASPVGVNPLVIENDETGYLCDEPEQWEILLEKLIINPDGRTQIGKKGRQKVLDHYSVGSNSANFLSLFS